MTNEEMDRAIAEAVGWKPTTDGGICWDSEGNAIVTPPKYSTDLNAMHEAEETLTECQRELFVDNIIRMCPFDKTNGFDWMHATATQRAEAFLRTIGKYSDATHPLP